MAHPTSKRVIYAALIGNLLIAATKFAAAVFTSSAAMLSEAIHSTVDSGNQLLLLFGIRRAARPDYFVTAQQKRLHSVPTQEPRSPDRQSATRRQYQVFIGSAGVSRAPASVQSSKIMIEAMHLSRGRVGLSQ